MTKQEQGYNPKRGYRWHAVTTGKKHIVWGHTKELATVAAERVAADSGEELIKLDPAPADYRNAPRGGKLTQKLTFLVSQKDWDLLHEVFPTDGTFAASVRNLLMDAVRKLAKSQRSKKNLETAY